MPALPNPRHEAFAQAIFSGIVGAKGRAHSQAEAYRRAGYHVTNGNSAKACASRLLTFANGIGERVKELQAIAAENAVESTDKVVQELNELKREAKADKAYSAAVSAVMGKVKVLNLVVDQPPNTSIDFSSANSMHELGKRLLQSVGFAAPDDASIAAAIEANDALRLGHEPGARRRQGIQSGRQGDRLHSAARARRQRLLRRPLPQPAVHGGQPLDLFALRKHAGRSWRVSTSSLRRRSRRSPRSSDAIRCACL